MSDEEVIEQIRGDLESSRTREDFDAVLKSAYAAGWTLQRLGDVCGVSREAIRLRLRRHVPAERLTQYPPPRKARDRAHRAARRVANRKRVNGLRLNSPLLQIPVWKLNRIAELHELVTQVRGWTPMDDPRRLAMPEYKALLVDVFETYHVPQGRLGPIFGLSARTLDLWLKNHGGLGGPSPSQRAYKGVHVSAGYRGPGSGKRQKLVALARESDEWVVIVSDAGRNYFYRLRSEYPELEWGAESLGGGRFSIRARRPRAGSGSDGGRIRYHSDGS